MTTDMHKRGRGDNQVHQPTTGLDVRNEPVTMGDTTVMSRCLSEPTTKRGVVRGCGGRGRDGRHRQSKEEE